MANFDSVRIALSQREELLIDPETIPDSTFSITNDDEGSPPAPPKHVLGIPFRRVDDKEQEPSDWRLEYRTAARPNRHPLCPFIYLPFLYAYALLGAWWFTFLEGPSATTNNQDSNNSTNTTTSMCNSTEGPTNTNHPAFSHWILDGVPYAVSVFTTVGYGLQAPMTWKGRLVTIFYASFGIPLYFAFAADLQDWVDRAIFVWLYEAINRNPKKAKLTRWHKFLVILFIAIAWLFLQGLVTMLIESGDKEASWDYMTSIYFVFQSASLIGFGDLMASHKLYLTVHLPMLTIGQVLLTGLFTAMIKYIRYKVPKWARLLAKTVRDFFAKTFCKKEKKAAKKAKKKSEPDKSRREVYVEAEDRKEEKDKKKNINP